MSTEPDNLMLEQLRAMPTHQDVQAARLTRLEDMVRGLSSIMAGIARRLEGIEDRLGRIEQVKA
jgi:hypothetical protein